MSWTTLAGAFVLLAVASFTSAGWTAFLSALCWSERAYRPLLLAFPLAFLALGFALVIVAYLAAGVSS